MKTNYSSQRNLVEQVLKSCCDHPTAEMVYLRCKQINPKIGIATVYRNLDMLEKNAVIEKISTPTGKDRFDLKKSKHSHAICNICGKVFDFEPNFDMISLKSKIYKQTKLETSNDEIQVVGICEKCKNK